MKQVIQNYRTGELSLVETPIPAVKSGGVLVRNVSSLVSSGTEKLMINLAKKSLLEKAKARPDLVKKVISKVKSDGPISAYKKAMRRLDNPVPLGYSCAGKIEKVGKEVSEFKEGDGVACFGSRYASHAEMVFVPKNLAVKIPEKVSFEEAAFVALGAIALHAVRCANVSLGENVAVIGLGLLGLLTVQLLNASGCSVFGIDTKEDKIELAKQFGAKEGSHSSKNVKQRIQAFTDAYGVDAVIIFASTQSNQPIEQAAKIARERANIVVPGMVGLDIPRKIFYEKELNLVVSRSAGPGIYNPTYEEKGLDYPISYVRWTEKRNMKQFLELVAEGKVKLDPLITHRFKIDKGTDAYKLIMENKEPYIGVILEYDTGDEEGKHTKKVGVNKSKLKRKPKGTVGVGLIGAGQYAKGTLLPAIKKINVPISLRGVATATGSSGKHVAKKFGFNYCTTDYQELLEDQELDVVLIATRHHLHASMTMDALKAGKHVFVEKPLCLTQSELEKIIKAYNSVNSTTARNSMNPKTSTDTMNCGVMVGFNRRFSSFSVRAKELFGPVNEPVVINCRVNAGYVPKDSWIQDPQEGGGRIIGEVCHFVDLIQYFSESVPQSVYAKCISGSGKNIPFQENIIVTIELQDGSTGSITYVSIGDKSYPRERVEVFGQNSVITIDNFRSMSFTKEGRTKGKRNFFSTDRGHRNEMKTLFKTIKEGKNVPVDFEEYIYTTLSTFKIQESLKTGRAIKIKLDELLI